MTAFRLEQPLDQRQVRGLVRYAAHAPQLMPLANENLTFLPFGAFARVPGLPGAPTFRVARVHHACIHGGQPLDQYQEQDLVRYSNHHAITNEAFEPNTYHITHAKFAPCDISPKPA